jgi:hypothetical protein
VNYTAPRELHDELTARFGRFPLFSFGGRRQALMDVIPLDANLVKGSHGRPTDDAADGPLLISSDAALLPPGPLAATDVKALILRHLFDDAQ